MNITEKFVEDNKGKRFNITMKDGKVLKNIAFFNYHGTPCYMTSRQKVRGRYIPYDWNIEKIEEVVKVEYTNEGNAKKLLKKLHANCWDNLKEDWTKIANGEEVTRDFEWHFIGKLKFRNITKEFKWQEHELELLKQAFENKTEYRWSRTAMRPQGRDLSISTKLGDDGIFRAWFSSEFAGCGNGDYYLLLNPTTAVYYERD